MTSPNCAGDKRERFNNQRSALDAVAPDAILLETFADLTEARIALETVGEPA